MEESLFFPLQIPSNDINCFSKIIHKIESKLKVIKNLSTDSLITAKSSTALEEIFETAKNTFKTSNAPEKDLLNFNRLFCEAKNLNGLIKITKEINVLAENYMPSFKHNYDVANERILKKDYDGAIDLYVEILQGLDRVGRLPKRDQNFVLDIQYSLGCLYMNRDKDDDSKLAKQIFSSYLDNTRFVMESNPSCALLIAQHALHGLALAHKNNCEYHFARVYLEKELDLIDFIQRRMISGAMVLNQDMSLAQKYTECFSVLGRTHDLLGNDTESVLFFSKATLAEEGLNYAEVESIKQRDFVKNLVGGGNQGTTFAEKNKDFNEAMLGEPQKPKPAEVDTLLSETSAVLKNGENFVSEDELQKIKREVDWKLAPILEKESANDSTWRFGAEGFDPYVFLKCLNEAYMRDRDSQCATQELSAFLNFFMARHCEEREQAA